MGQTEKQIKRIRKYRKKVKPLMDTTDRMITTLDRVCKKSLNADDRQAARSLITFWLRNHFLTPKQYSLVSIIIARYKKQGDDVGIGTYFCYLIRGGDYVKIGFCTNVQKRMAGIQTGNPCKLELVGKRPCNSEKEARFLERKLHRLCKRFSCQGEWFDLEPTLRRIKNCGTIGLGAWVFKELN